MALFRASLFRRVKAKTEEGTPPGTENDVSGLRKICCSSDKLW